MAATKSSELLDHGCFGDTNAIEVIEDLARLFTDVFEGQAELACVPKHRFMQVIDQFAAALCDLTGEDITQ
jgi:hypothetical protein